jgi:hypothetical protein
LIPDYLSKTVLIKNLENRFLFAGELYLWFFLSFLFFIAWFN